MKKDIFFIVLNRKSIFGLSRETPFSLCNGLLDPCPSSYLSNQIILQYLSLDFEGRFIKLDLIKLQYFPKSYSRILYSPLEVEGA